jgi:hypothetical protein
MKERGGPFGVPLSSYSHGGLVLAAIKSPVERYSIVAPTDCGPWLTVSQAMTLTPRRCSGLSGLPLGSELAVRGAVLGRHDVGESS